jgi:hypothetical protein
MPNSGAPVILYVVSVPSEKSLGATEIRVTPGLPWAGGGALAATRSDFDFLLSFFVSDRCSWAESVSARMAAAVVLCLHTPQPDRQTGTDRLGTTVGSALCIVRVL